MMRHRSTPTRPSPRPPRFQRVICALKRSPSALEAARQASLLAATAPVLLIVAIDAWDHVSASEEETTVMKGLRAQANDAISIARETIGNERCVDSKIVEGRPDQVILAEVEGGHDVLLALGGDQHGRGRGYLRSGLSTEMLHRAPCSVLIARAGPNPESFPETVVVGVDGSTHSIAAHAVAVELCERVDASLRVIAATGGKGIDRAAAERTASNLEPDSRSPVDALVAASQEADLLVVGSRGLHGLRALGSVSERVAHRAACSVLTVRGEATAAA